MNIHKHIEQLENDSRVNKTQLRRSVSALYLNESIKEDEKQLRKLIHSDKNLNGCNVTAMLINEIIADIKANKDELYSLGDTIPAILKEVCNVSIVTQPKQPYDIMLHAFN